MDICAARGDQGGEADCAEQTETLLGIAARPVRGSHHADCPVSRGHAFDNGDFSGIALGPETLPVFPVVAVADRKHALQGKLSVERRGRWWSIKTAWFARPRYGDPFLIRGDRSDGPGVVRFGEGRCQRANARSPRWDTQRGQRVSIGARSNIR